MANGKMPQTTRSAMLLLFPIFVATMLFGTATLPLLPAANATTTPESIQAPFSNADNTTAAITDNNATAIHSFEDAFIELVNNTRTLSFAYQDEIAKFQSGIYDTRDFATITDIYLQMYEQLINKTDVLQQQSSSLPANYSKAIDLYANSIEAEMQSHLYYRDYVVTGDLADNERSLELLSDSLTYEIEAFRAFRSAAGNNNATADSSNITNTTISTTVSMKPDL